MSQLKIKDGNSWINIPAGGIGVPSGGNQGDVLVKSSATDYATEWREQPNVLLKKFSSTFAANSASKTITAPDIDGYTFLCWVGFATNGWVGAMTNGSIDKKTGSFWRTATSSAANFNAWALYVKGFTVTSE